MRSPRTWPPPPRASSISDTRKSTRRGSPLVVVGDSRSAASSIDGARGGSRRPRRERLAQVRKQRSTSALKASRSNGGGAIRSAAVISSRSRLRGAKLSPYGVEVALLDGQAPPRAGPPWGGRGEQCALREGSPSAAWGRAAFRSPDGRSSSGRRRLDQ